MQPLAPILDALESFYGVQSPGSPVDPYLFLIWWHCGYPPSEERCNRGWEALTAATGVSAAELTEDCHHAAGAVNVFEMNIGHGRRNLA